MIYYSSNALDICKSNIVCLEELDAEENAVGYYYLSVDTLCSAAIINDMYDGDLDILINRKFSGELNHKKAIVQFFETAPEPVNILAPFLSLCSDAVEFDEDISVMCGALHIMSQSITFDVFLKLDNEARKNVMYTKTAVMKYKSSWTNMLIQDGALKEPRDESVTVNERIPMFNQQPMYYPQQPYPQQPYPPQQYQAPYMPQETMGPPPPYVPDAPVKHKTADELGDREIAEVDTPMDWNGGIFMILKGETKEDAVSRAIDELLNADTPEVDATLESLEKIAEDTVGMTDDEKAAVREATEMERIFGLFGEDGE